MTLKEKFVELQKQRWHNDAKMVDYCVKKTDALVEIRGCIFSIDKPNIEKHFCFDDSFDYNGALRMAEHARTSESYFIEKNLEEINSMINDLKTSNYYVYTHSACKELCYIRSEGYVNMFAHSDMKNASNILTDEEKQAIIKAYEEVKERFAKRLNTYLKRYGLSNVHSWTYWGMA